MPHNSGKMLTHYGKPYNRHSLEKQSLRSLPNFIDGNSYLYSSRVSPINFEESVRVRQYWWKQRETKTNLALLDDPTTSLNPWLSLFCLAWSNKAKKAPRTADHQRKVPPPLFTAVLYSSSPRYAAIIDSLFPGSPLDILAGKVQWTLYQSWLGLGLLLLKGKGQILFLLMRCMRAANLTYVPKEESKSKPITALFGRKDAGTLSAYSLFTCGEAVRS